MKIFVVIFALVAAIAADEIQIDWSSVKPVREMPHFWKSRPSVFNVIGAKSFIGNRRIVNGEIAELVDFRLNFF